MGKTDGEVMLRWYVCLEKKNWQKKAFEAGVEGRGGFEVLRQGKTKHCNTRTHTHTHSLWYFCGGVACVFIFWLEPIATLMSSCQRCYLKVLTCTFESARHFLVMM